MHEALPCITIDRLDGWMDGWMSYLLSIVNSLTSNSQPQHYNSCFSESYLTQASLFSKAHDSTFMNSGPLNSTLILGLQLILNRGKKKNKKAKLRTLKWTSERTFACSQHNCVLFDLQCVLRGTHPYCFANVTPKHFHNWLRVSDKQAGGFEYRICTNEDSTIPFLKVQDT